jgi:hypothetical protein
LRDEGEHNVEVDGDDTDEEDGKGEGGCDAGADGEGHGDDEEEGDHKGVDWVEQGHGDVEGCFMTWLGGSKGRGESDDGGKTPRES